MKTLHSTAELSEEIKRSRFIARAIRVDSLPDTLAFYDAVKEASASHNCWAFRIGQTYRFSDDGEPAGTAGKPILAAVDGLGLDQVMVVVTRYFGGIKLGIGGLVRAYGGISSRCLQQARIVEEQKRLRVLLQVPFEYVNTVHRLMLEFDAEKDAEDYQGAGVQFRLNIPEQRVGGLQSSLLDATRGTVRFRRLADTV